MAQNPNPNPQPQRATVTASEARAAFWQAIGKIASKESDRGQLPAGATYDVGAAIVAGVNGREITATIGADVKVGDDTTRASSRNPQPAALVAYLLAKLNEATRERVLRELPEAFAAAGGEIPESDPAAVAAADVLLRRLRQRVEQPVKGSVKVNYHIA